MPSYCASFGCNNNGYLKGISFHSFPLNNKPVLKEWLNKMKRESFAPNKNSKICSDHFEDDCFSFQNFTGKRFLKSSAVPTKFTFSKKRNRREKNPYQIRNKENVPSTSSEKAILQISNVFRENELLSTSLAAVPLTNDVSTETGDDFIKAVLDRNTRLEEKLQDLQLKFQKIIFRLEAISNNEMMKRLTGVSRETFNVIFSLLCLKDYLSPESNLSHENQLFLFLVYLRTGISQIFLAHLFQIQQSTVSKICSKVSDIMYTQFKSIPIWPSKDKVRETMPPAFFKHYSACRIILDCTEFTIQHPTSPTLQQVTFSYYKNANTLKAMVGITPSGAISFISDMWGGSISDKDLFLKSGILSHLEPGDLVLADRGFLIKKELEKVGCNLITPHFLANKIKFTQNEKSENKCVAHHRVHIERAMGKIKNYKYFEGAISNCCLNTVNKYFYIIAFLVNFGNPLFNPK